MCSLVIALIYKQKIWCIIKSGDLSYKARLLSHYAFFIKANTCSLQRPFLKVFFVLKLQCARQFTDEIESYLPGLVISRIMYFLYIGYGHNGYNYPTHLMF